jgi:NAD(P)-dependent dehydrogenase (short-subunit alcohol dehydrogenase family)
MDVVTSRAVLITGCSSGIGRSTALRLARAGWPVYATARRPETIEDLAGDCTVLPLDVTDEESMRAAVAAIERDAGAVGVLINNAGYSQSGAVETVPLDLVRQQFETNLFGAVRLTQLVLPAMRRQRQGRIINISTIGGKLSFPGGAVYHASKHALESVSDVLRFELRPFGIDVILIEPGLIRSGFAAAAVTSMAPLGDRTGPYGSYNDAVAAATTSAYESGTTARLSAGPEDVAKIIERALTARRPRTRYTVTPSAPLMLTLHALLPDRAWDRLLRSRFPEPDATSEPPPKPTTQD